MQNDIMVRVNSGIIGNYTGLEELFYHERYARNYINWLWSFCSGHIGSSVVEIGAGIGAFTGYWLKHSTRVLAIEPAANCASILRQRYDNDPRVEIVQEEISKIKQKHYGSYDTAISINVFEHIQDDMSALIKTQKMLLPGGKFILLVPAFPELYGEIDLKVGHHRRYCPNELKDKLRESGFKIIDMRYFDLVGIMPWWLLKKRRRNVSKVNIILFDIMIVPWSRAIEELIRPPCGLSIFAIAEKIKS